MGEKFSAPPKFSCSKMTGKGNGSRVRARIEQGVNNR